MTHSQSTNHQNLSGESRGNRSLHKTVNRDDVWHSVWKRIENTGPAGTVAAGELEKTLQAPCDYVIELG